MTPITVFHWPNDYPNFNQPFCYESRIGFCYTDAHMKNPKVDAFLKKRNHPLNREIQMVRAIILSTDSRIEEDIKWSVPTFMYKGNIASYYMNAKKFVSLMFHKGATISDNSGLLEGDGKEARTARFVDTADIKKKRKKLEGVIKEWIKMKDLEG